MENETSSEPSWLLRAVLVSFYHAKWLTRYASVRSLLGLG